MRNPKMSPEAAAWIAEHGGEMSKAQQKKQYGQVQAAEEALPKNYQTMIDALEYAMQTWPNDPSWVVSQHHAAMAWAQDLPDATLEQMTRVMDELYNEGVALGGFDATFVPPFHRIWMRI